MSIEKTREVDLGEDGKPELFTVGDIYGDGVLCVQLQTAEGNNAAGRDPDACAVAVKTPKQLRYIAYACLAAAEEMEG